MLSAVVNRTGDPMFDDTLGEALARAAAAVAVPERPAPSSSSRRRLRLMGREPDDADHRRDRARGLPAQCAAKALLGGTIASARLVVRVDAERAGLRHRQGAGGGTGAGRRQGEVLRAMGSAVSGFREKLGESLASMQRYDARIEEATTPSLEALKAYSQGLRTRRTHGRFRFGAVLPTCDRTGSASSRSPTRGSGPSTRTSGKPTNRAGDDDERRTSSARRSAKPNAITSRRATTATVTEDVRRRSKSTAAGSPPIRTTTPRSPTRRLHKQQGGIAQKRFASSSWPRRWRPISRTRLLNLGADALREPTSSRKRVRAFENAILSCRTRPVRQVGLFSWRS